jgi:uncharacterized protein (TIGR02186 family)
MRALVLVLLLIALPARAGEIVGALSQNRVSLTANFSGSEILIFGAIRHDANRFRDDAPFDIIITVEGPRQPVAIWRKARRFGIWVNTDVAWMASVPSFYAVATTAPLERILAPDEDARLRISPGQAIRPDQISGSVPDPAAFPAALLRLREAAQAYQRLDRWVYLDRDILFRATVRLPANLTEGAYTTRMYLVREGRVVHDFRTAIFVRKEGLERWLSQLAFENPWAYGLMALVIALAAGWGASWAARLFRR